MTRLDISKGIDPIPVSSDIREDRRICRIEGKQYIFYGQLPFTLKPVRRNGYDQHCADKALVLKHSDKAIIKDLTTLEVIRG